MGPGHIGAGLLMGLFIIGAIGCIITIPLCALKFFAVLMERSKVEESPEPELGPSAAAQTIDSLSYLLAPPERIGLRYRIIRRRKNRRSQKAAGRKRHY